jgi:hypothetical protein
MELQAARRCRSQKHISTLIVELAIRRGFVCLTHYTLKLIPILVFLFMPSNLTINIGAITTAIEWHFERFEFVVPQSYQPFVSNSPAELHLGLHLGVPELELKNQVFDGPPIWSLYRNRAASVVNIFDLYSDLQRLLVLPFNFKRADLYFTVPGGPFIDPFFGPTMELLMINYLAQGHGVIIHACGIEHNGTGLLFAGESGAGKSTLANLWNRSKGAAILSDDRTIVRYVDGELWIYGTPWHGEAKFGSPRGVKLDKIFFLRHSQINAIQPLSRVESVLRMLQCSFPPYWDAAGMEYTMELFEKIVAQVPCYELAFEPNESAIETLKRYNGSVHGTRLTAYNY